MTLYRKYRPQKFADLIGQDHIRDTLLQAVKENKLSSAYLFSGPRGTGKTSMARLIAKAANCQTISRDIEAGKKISGEPCGECSSCLEISRGSAIDIIEIDAASNRSIDDIRQLREQIKFAPHSSKYKVYIIDEVHMLTREAFNALLKTLEEPPKHAIFILATTDPHKVLPTIVSRTQRFDFKRIGEKDLIKSLKSVAKAEKLITDSESLEIIAMMADGASRDSLSMLEQVAAYSNNISAETVRNILGVPEIGEVINLLRAIFNLDAEEGLKIAHSLFNQGADLGQLNSLVLDVLRKLLNLAVAGRILAVETESNRQKIDNLFEEIKQRSTAKSQSEILSVTRSFVEASKMMKETIDPLVALEVAIIESVDLIGSKNLKSDQKSNPAAPNEPKALLSETKAVNPANHKTQAVEDRGVSTKVENTESKKVKESNRAEPDQTKEVESDKEPLSGLSLEAWGNVIGEIKKENSSLAALLRDAKPMAVESGKVVLGVRFKFHKDKISEAKNVSILEGVICNVTGNSCRVICEIADFSKLKPRQSHSDDELADEAEKVFGK